MCMDIVSCGQNLVLTNGSLSFSLHLITSFQGMGWLGLADGFVVQYFFYAVLLSLLLLCVYYVCVCGGVKHWHSKTAAAVVYIII